MKNIYIVKQYIWNGTVLIKTDSSVYESLELAEQVKSRLDELNNKDSIEYFTVTTDIELTTLYENEHEVPILNIN